MRALGVISDKAIIECCLLDLNAYSKYIDLFIPSIHDAGKIFTQEIALKYIATFTKGKTVSHTLEILVNYLLPQVGELNFRDKACYIGYIVLELLKVFTKENKPTDRDSFKYKRIEVPGLLLYASPNFANASAIPCTPKPIGRCKKFERRVFSVG